jgi:hypothetical protein
MIELRMGGVGWASKHRDPADWTVFYPRLTDERIILTYRSTHDMVTSFAFLPDITTAKTLSPLSRGANGSKGAPMG